MSDIEEISKNLDPNNPFSALILMLYKGLLGNEIKSPFDIYPTVGGHKLTEEECNYRTKKLSAWLAYHTLIEFLATDKYPGDEVSSILKNLWRAKEEILPNLKEQEKIIIKDLDEKNLCFPWMKPHK